MKRSRLPPAAAAPLTGLAALTLLLSACATGVPTVESYPDDAARWTVVRGTNIHYFDYTGEGAGLPILWIHGYSGTGFETLAISDQLDDTSRLIAPDLPGCGFSAKPDMEYTLDYFVRFVEDFIDELELDRYVLVGHSMGGMIASTFAARSPPGLERLILIAPYGFEGEAGAVPEFLASTGVLVDYGLELHNETLMEIAMRASVFYDPNRIPRDLVDYLSVSTFHTENAIPALASITRNIIAGEHDTSVLDRIAVPTLIIWGADDRVLDFRYAARFNRRIPNSTLQAIPDCGHLPHVEYPAETARIMTEWLAEE